MRQRNSRDLGVNYSGNRRKILEDLFRKLHDAYGSQKWWPAESDFEVVVGAILTQNTSWHNVEKCILNLKKHNLLSPEHMKRCKEDLLEECIHPSGFFRQKAKKLKNLLTHLFEKWDGSLELFFDQPMETLRKELLGLKGIGPETADSIILYAAHKPSFVVDRYTFRVLTRHGYFNGNYDYEALRTFFMASLRPEVALFKEFHALFVRLGKSHCKSTPLCSGCPLEHFT